MTMTENDENVIYLLSHFISLHFNSFTWLLTWREKTKMKRNLKQSEIQKKKNGKIPRKNIKFLIAFVFFLHLILFFLMCVRSLFSLLLAGEMAFFAVVVVVVDDN